MNESTRQVFYYCQAGNKPCIGAYPVDACLDQQTVLFRPLNHSRHFLGTAPPPPGAGDCSCAYSWDALYVAPCDLLELVRSTFPYLTGARCGPGFATLTRVHPGSSAAFAGFCETESGVCTRDLGTCGSGHYRFVCGSTSTNISVWLAFEFPLWVCTHCRALRHYCVCVFWGTFGFTLQYHRCLRWYTFWWSIH